MSRQKSNLSVSFGSPHWNWLAMEVRCDDRTLALDASSVPNDFLAELISALCTLAGAQGLAEATANEEPAEVEFAFKRTGQHVQLAVCRRPEWGEDLAIEGTLAEVVLPFWRALRRLQFDEALEQHWRRQFPSASMDRLTELVAEIKAAIPTNDAE